MGIIICGDTNSVGLDGNYGTHIHIAFGEEAGRVVEMSPGKVTKELAERSREEAAPVKGKREQNYKQRRRRQSPAYFLGKKNITHSGQFSSPFLCQTSSCDLSYACSLREREGAHIQQFV